MASNYQELVEETRGRVCEISPAELRRRIDAQEPLLLLDVREPDEYRAGCIPGAVLLPRGLLEAQIEELVPDIEARIVIYCSVGIRSAFAAETLGELGYSRVESLFPGFSSWRELGHPVERPVVLSDAQRERYARHVALPEVGEAGQVKLLASRVLLVGAGGLGSPAALYLAAAGVGTLGVVDDDAVDATNLQRQVLHTTSRVGMRKVESAARAIAELNPDVRVVPYDERLTGKNVERLTADYDVVVDGADNFPTRYLVSDASVTLGFPVVHGSIFRFEGQVTTFIPERAAARTGFTAGPCYRCLFPLPPPPEDAPNCRQAGVFGVLCGVIGSLQATETLKLLLRKGAPLRGRLLTYDALTMRVRELTFSRDPACPACGDEPTLRGYVDYEGFCRGEQ